MNKRFRFVPAKLAVLSAIFAAGAANAAVDAATKTAVEGAKADVTELGALVFTVYLALKIIKWARRAL